MRTCRVLSKCPLELPTNNHRSRISSLLFEEFHQFRPCQVETPLRLTTPLESPLLRSVCIRVSFPYVAHFFKMLINTVGKRPHILGKRWQRDFITFCQLLDTSGKCLRDSIELRPYDGG